MSTTETCLESSMLKCCVFSNTGTLYCNTMLVCPLTVLEHLRLPQISCGFITLSWTPDESGYQIHTSMKSMMLLLREDCVVYIHSAFFMKMKCFRFSWNACIFNCYYTRGELCPLHTAAPLQTPLPSFFESNFFCKIQKFTMHVNGYRKCTKKYIEASKSVMNDMGTHCNIRHCWFQLVPVSLSLAHYASVRNR